MKYFILLTSLFLLSACGKSTDKKDGSLTTSDRATSTGTLENLADTEAEPNPFMSFHGTYDVKVSSDGCKNSLEKIKLKRQADEVVKFEFSYKNESGVVEYNVFVNKFTKGAAFMTTDNTVTYNSGEMHGTAVRELSLTPPDTSSSDEEDKIYFTFKDLNYNSADPEGTEEVCEFKLDKRNSQGPAGGTGSQNKEVESEKDLSTVTGESTKKQGGATVAP